jgi:hypothetical protein
MPKGVAKDVRADDPVLEYASVEVEAWEDADLDAVLADEADARRDSVDELDLADIDIFVDENDVPTGSFSAEDWQDSSHVRPKPGRDDTARMLQTTDAVPVWILSGATELAQDLIAWLGPSVRVSTAHDSGAIHRWLSEPPPLLLVIDALAPPSIRKGDLSALITNVPETATVVLWGHDVPAGWSVAAILEQHRVRVVSLREADGTAPLMDLIRARREVA